MRAATLLLLVVGACADPEVLNPRVEPPADEGRAREWYLERVGAHPSDRVDVRLTPVTWLSGDCVEFDPPLEIRCVLGAVVNSWDGDRHVYLLRERTVGESVLFHEITHLLVNDHDHELAIWDTVDDASRAYDLEHGNLAP